MRHHPYTPSRPIIRTGAGLFHTTADYELIGRVIAEKRRRLRTPLADDATNEVKQ